MEKLFLNFKALPRWVILLIDLTINCLSFTLSYFIAKHFEFTEIIRGHFFIYTGSYVVVSLLVFSFMRVHTGLIRYSNIHDILRIFLAVFITSIIYPIVVTFIIIRNFNFHSLDISTVLLVNFFIATSLLVLLRIGVKESYNYIKQISVTNMEKILIYGCGNTALLIKQAMEASDTKKYIIAGFITPDGNKVHAYIQQKKVYSLKELAYLRDIKKVTSIVLMEELSPTLGKKLVIEKCLQLGIKILTVPSPGQWVTRNLTKQIKEMNIEDLLQRAPIVINNLNISKEILNKRVLITGAAGSIGSEIVRQVLIYKPEMVILCDQAESSLHEIQLSIEEQFPNSKIKIFIASIRDFKRMEFPFHTYNPEIVFHAAAYKHVPMMENHPAEAILTNVLGTKNLVDLSILYNVSKFVMISTDKAVNPTNVMGTSKRIAEMYVQALSSTIDYPLNEVYGILNKQNGNEQSNFFAKTKFITTRFGNVLNSNGSVIPRFKEQIQHGGPITVTDPEITRYFMTIPEAVQLVLEACTMGCGGEIFVFDMGQPVKIIDLAKKMIQLAGLVPDMDIKIVFTGLRPGEKLYEELLNKQELIMPTHHEKIKIAKVIQCNAQTIAEIKDLIEMSLITDSYKLVKKMKEMVPEYISRNSEYEILDHLFDESHLHA